MTACCHSHFLSLRLLEELLVPWDDIMAWYPSTGVHVGVLGLAEN